MADPAIPLPDPEICRECHSQSRVIDSRPMPGYRWRRHECLQCQHRWSSYQMLINPHRLVFKMRVSILDTTISSGSA